MSPEFYLAMAFILFCCLAIAFIYAKQWLDHYIEDKVIEYIHEWGGEWEKAWDKKWGQQGN